MEQFLTLGTTLHHLHDHHGPAATIVPTSLLQHQSNSSPGSRNASIGGAVDNSAEYTISGAFTTG